MFGFGRHHHPVHNPAILICVKDGKVQEIKTFGSFASRVYVANADELAKITRPEDRLQQILDGAPTRNMEHMDFNQFLEKLAKDSGPSPEAAPPPAASTQASVQSTASAVVEPAPAPAVPAADAAHPSEAPPTADEHTAPATLSPTTSTTGPASVAVPPISN